MNIDKTPRKIVVMGNKNYGLQFLGEAQSQLAILENQMKFQGLSQGSRKVKINDNIFIECWSCFSAQGIKIITTGIPEEVPIPELEKKCWCGNCFTYAIIVDRYPNELTSSNFMDVISYNVEYCTIDNNYVLLENYIYGSSYEEYFVNDLVIIGFIPKSEIDCCNEITECHFDESIKNFDEKKIAIFPFNVGKMEEWTYE